MILLLHVHIMVFLQYLYRPTPYKGPMTPYTPLNIANIRNIDLLPTTPFNIF